MRVTSKPYVTNWANLAPVGERKQNHKSVIKVSFMRTFPRRDNVFPHNSQRYERTIGP